VSLSGACCVAAKQQRVDELHDTLKQIDLQAPGPEDEDQMTKQIRPLENRLDKAMIKYNEAQNIRRTYEQVDTVLSCRRP